MDRGNLTKPHLEKRSYRELKTLERGRIISPRAPKLSYLKPTIKGLSKLQLCAYLHTYITIIIKEFENKQRRRG